MGGGWCRVCRIEAPLVTCMGSELCCVCLCVELLRCLLCPHEVLGHGAVWQTECCFSSTLGELQWLKEHSELPLLTLTVRARPGVSFWKVSLSYHIHRSSPWQTDSWTSTLSKIQSSWPTCCCTPGSQSTPQVRLMSEWRKLLPPFLLWGCCFCQNYTQPSINGALRLHKESW